MTEENPTPTTPFPFVLRVRDWYRGSCGSKLLTSDGRQCCVGQLAEQCGVPREQLLNKGAVFSLDHIPRELDWSVATGNALVGVFMDGKTNSAIALTIYRANDDPTTSDEEKIEELTKLFARVGVEMTVDRESTKRDVE